MQRPDPNDPIVWLLLLERGRRTGDFELAARAQRALRELGIRVTYSRRPRSRSRRKPARRQA
jgi:hypothetical protein